MEFDNSMCNKFRSRIMRSYGLVYLASQVVNTHWYSWHKETLFCFNIFCCDRRFEGGFSLHFPRQYCNTGSPKK